ncbi:nucleoid-associated protein [Nocardioides sp.]|uniref:Nucleoid-associated protein n=1 Tax=metagenome TaxID=256318 RepID=A0A2P2BXA0_9ZZZZ
MVTALHIETVILHGINKTIRGEATEPDLSDGASDLSDRIRGFLQEQVRTALKHGRQIVEETGLSGTGDLVRGFWTSKHDLLTCSRELARTLQHSQPAQSPEGLLMVADARADGQRVFVLAKLEHERGAQATRERDAQGNMIYTMQFLDDLFFTTGSRVFKIGYFPITADPEAALQGLVVDRQAQAHHVARYFRESYLGCVWRERPELVTERFYDTVQSWIDTVGDPEKRARYQVGLISELQSQTTGLSVSGFATKHLDAGDRDDFVATARQVLPASELPKSLEFVKAKLNNVRIDTATGTIVIAPPERMKDGTVRIEDDQLGVSTITIHDTIEKTSGTGQFKQS